jgi:hypothetical protein
MLRLKSISLVLAFMGLVAIASAQVVDVPNKAKEDLAAKYPKATEVDWDNHVTYYTAAFKMSGKNYVAHYKIDGKFKYTLEELTLATLPSAVQQSFKNSKESDWNVLSAAHITRGKDEELYRIEVKNGLEKKYMYFNKSGKEVKSKMTL